jgi:phosphatidate cytidylyltransferase
MRSAWSGQVNAGARSGIGVRVATALVLLPLVVGAVWFGPPALVVVLACATVVISLWEFFAIGERQGLKGFRLLTLLCGIGVVVSQWSTVRIRPGGVIGGSFQFVQTWELPQEWVFLLFVLGLGAHVVWGRGAPSEALPALGTSAAGLLLVAWPLSYIVRIHAVETGRLWLLFTLALIWAGDTLAYFTGRAVGQHPMAPQISPKKTWEGAAGNVVGSLLAAGIFSRWLDVGLTHLLAIALLANVAGQLGDLVESAYKRGAGVKDSGTLLPGHGGMLDRVDALIFAAPVVWVYLSFVLA